MYITALSASAAMVRKEDDFLSRLEFIVPVLVSAPMLNKSPVQPSDAAQVSLAPAQRDLKSHHSNNPYMQSSLTNTSRPSLLIVQ